MSGVLFALLSAPQRDNLPMRPMNKLFDHLEELPLAAFNEL